MKKIIYLFVSIVAISCGSETVNVTENEIIQETPLTKDDFKTPDNSKIWAILYNKDGFSASEVFNFYTTEKSNEIGKLHYNNTMAMWHKVFYSYSKDLTLTQSNEILEDMDAMEFNTVSFKTYYRLLYHHKNKTQDYRDRIDNFYKKNIYYLSASDWKNKDLQNQIINNLNKEHFIFI